MKTPTKIRPQDMVSFKTIAARCNPEITYNAACNWQARFEDFPEPLPVESDNTLFYWPQVEKWLIEHGKV